MKPTLAIAICAAIATGQLGARNTPPATDQPPVARVVNEQELEPQAGPPTTPAAATTVETAPPAATDPAPVAAAAGPETTADPGGPTEPAIPAEPGAPTGSPAATETAPAAQPAAPDPSTPTIILGAAENPHPTPGISLRVEKSPAASSAPKVSSVKLLAPFPPKALHQVPNGWVLKRSSDTKPFTQTVDLGNGNLATLSIAPFVLVPDDSQPKVFSVREPGHLASLQYRQTDTVGAILDKATNELEATDASLTEAINRLNQLLLSFPPELK